MTGPAQALDPVDILELAELLDFTAHALTWRHAEVIYPDLEAHLRRWARRLHPGRNWATTCPPGLSPEELSGLGRDSFERARAQARRGDVPIVTDPSTAGVTAPLCHDGVTMVCPICRHAFEPTGRQKFCSDACRAAAYRRRRDAGHPTVTVPKAQRRRPITVYECDSCGARAVGEQYCESCATFMRRVGIGGECPACDDPVAVVELLGEEVVTSR